MMIESKRKDWTGSAISGETSFECFAIRKYMKAETATQCRKKEKGASERKRNRPYLIKRMKEGAANISVLIKETQVNGYNGMRTMLRGYRTTATPYQ